MQCKIRIATRNRIGLGVFPWFKAVANVSWERMVRGPTAPGPLLHLEAAQAKGDEFAGKKGPAKIYVSRLPPDGLKRQLFKVAKDKPLVGALAAPGIIGGPGQRQVGEDARRDAAVSPHNKRPLDIFGTYKPPGARLFELIMNFYAVTLTHLH